MQLIDKNTFKKFCLRKLCLRKRGTVVYDALANVQNNFLISNILTIGNSTVNSAINSTFYTPPTSWTPSLLFAGSNTGMTYKIQSGLYITIGKLTLAEFHIFLSNVGSSTGTATIAGLNISTNPNFSSVISGDLLHANITGVSNDSILINPAGLSFALFTSNNIQLSKSNFTNTSQILGTTIFIAA